MNNYDLTLLKELRIGVLGGGVSSERAISLISARNAWKALQAQGLNPVFIDIVTSDTETVGCLLKNYNLDIAFIALHGYFGEDGGVQKILEDLSISYTGSDSNASRLAMDKILSKKIFQQAGVVTPDYTVHSDINVVPKISLFPLVAKPCAGGSSLGVSIVQRKEDLKTAFNKAFSQQNKVLLEKYIKGREITVGILEDEALAVVEIVPQSDYYDFTAKYKDEKTDFIVPAQLSTKTYNDCQKAALAAHRALGCRDFSRVDIRLSDDGIPYVLEVNSIPGLTAHSLLPLAAAACGISFDKLMIHMLHLALARKNTAQIN